MPGGHEAEEGPPETPANKFEDELAQPSAAIKGCAPAGTSYRGSWQNSNEPATAGALKRRAPEKDKPLKLEHPWASWESEGAEDFFSAGGSTSGAGGFAFEELVASVRRAWMASISFM